MVADGTVIVYRLDAVCGQNGQDSYGETDPKTDAIYRTMRAGGSDRSGKCAEKGCGQPI